jgi:dipeptidyl aminopeptidase/acylaminoacyl peptidase
MNPSSLFDLTAPTCRWRAACGIVFCLFAFATAALAQATGASEEKAPTRSRAEQVLASMPKVTRLEQVAISPDGSTVAWIQQDAIHLKSVNAAANEQTIANPDKCSLRDVAWSHDGKQMAYIATAKGDVPSGQIWVRDTSSGTSKKLADLKGYVSTPRFSSDDKTLAFLYIANMPRLAGPLVPMSPPEGVIEETYYEQRINTVDLAGGEVRAVSPADL